MDKLPTRAYYHEKVEGEYNVIVQNQNIVAQRLRETLLREWSETEEGKAFVQGLYNLQPKNGLIDVTYKLQNPIDITDVYNNLKGYWSLVLLPDYVIYSKLLGDGYPYKTIGTHRLKVTLGCWEAYPFSNSGNVIKEVFMRMYFD